ncbi:MAG: undecaprenyl/decaprenyl-phosphate alpha-N-acetylglucosaminyl 1-phosphate transferase [Bacteroidales bacterium]|nr:undecaprenyl/decaprenyl-phosphate alpha-N-acetylglucosaminyl 1-phosphate transferase [Bacteroidales bacterium]
MSTIGNSHFFISDVYFIVALCILNIIGYFLLLQSRGFLKKKNETGERFASQSKPIIGGTMFMVTIIGAFVYCHFHSYYSVEDNNLIPLLVCCILAFGMGYIDDVKNFSPLFKLTFQILCAIIFIATGTHISTSDNIFLNAGLTFFWVVGIMNSINMLDNMDGITASNSLIMFLGLAGIASGCDSIILLSIATCLLMFLLWNWHPAKMYMGDNGSQLLGVLLAYFSIKYVWNSHESIIGINYEQILFVALMFIIPITDTTTVAINRFLAGRSPFVGDRYHTTHCLVYKGFSIPMAVITLDIATIIGTLSSWYFITQRNGILTITEAIILVLYFIIVFSVLYFLNLHIRKENNLLYKKRDE